MWSTVALVIRFFAGITLLTAGAEKVGARKSFVRTLARLRLLGGPPAVALSFVVPATEIALGAALLAGLYWRLAAVGSAALLGCFAALLVASRSTKEGCGCGGLVGFRESMLKQAALDVGLLIGLTVTALGESTHLAVGGWGSPLEHREEPVTLLAVAMATVVILLVTGLSVGKFVRSNWSIIIAIARERQSRLGIR